MNESIENYGLRRKGLDILDQQLGILGQYARVRNHDLGPDSHCKQVTCLSPYIRHRLILESEVIQAALSRYSFQSIEKFIQEVYWRTYWKGWLEQRPQVWADFLSDLREFEEGKSGNTYLSAVTGQTGIDCFDHWTQELKQTGYLHNHARMWYASIWIFTLNLPWQLGAAFFLEHLLDGDAASNTLSWRWVAGLQTVGKHYVARAENIQKFTAGRFNPKGLLNENPNPCIDDRIYVCDRKHIQIAPIINPSSNGQALLILDDDCCPEISEIKGSNILAAAAIFPESVEKKHNYSPQVSQFKRSALEDALKRWHVTNGSSTIMLKGSNSSEQILNWYQATGARQLVILRSPTGPAADFIIEFEKESGIKINVLTRKYDQELWPFARAGFFQFKKNIRDHALKLIS